MSTPYLSFKPKNEHYISNYTIKLKKMGIGIFNKISRVIFVRKFYKISAISSSV